MSLSKQTVWQHSNRYSADSACAQCEGVVCHEPWCSSQNATVRYAFEAVLHPDRLTPQDTLILHALGVVWNQKT